MGPLRGIFEIFAAYRRSRDPWDPSQAGQGRDRRVFHRVPVRVACQMQNRVYGLQAHGMLMDLSLGGAGFVVPVNWPEGGHVRLEVESFGFEADAIIVFRKEEPPAFHYGVQFKRLKLSEVYKLRRLLRDHHSGPLTI